MTLLAQNIFPTKETVKYAESDEDVPRFLEALKNHQDTAEYGYRIKGLCAEVLERGATKITQWSSLRWGSLSHLSTIRRSKHEEIVGALLENEAKAPLGYKPVGVMLLGPPGAGKTSTGSPLIKKRFGTAFTSINPDDVKERLPEYEGWNASALHEESSHVAESMIKRQAINGRYNLIYDITGRKQAKVSEAIDELAEYGYDVYLMLIDLEPWRAACRVWARFQDNPFGRHKLSVVGSRYVPADYVYNEVGLRPAQTYNAMRQHPVVKGYCRLDASKPQEEQPCLIEKKGW